MKMYVFERIDKVTDAWHPEGGLMIVAEDKEHAMEMIEKEEDIEVTVDEWDNVIEYELKDSVLPTIYVFPDAGCC